MQPLDGIVVLDLTRLLPGEVAVGMLASAGAHVIPIRLPQYDLKSPAARAEFLHLADTADVLIESFRPGVMRGFGLDYDTLRARNPRLIYAAITGYGRDGPYAAMAGHDINYLAMAGVLDITGVKDGPPVIPGVQIADLAGGAMQAVIGILLALAERRRTGLGSMVDASMFHGSLQLLPIALMLRAAGRSTARGDSLLTGRYACYHLYETADGRWLAVGALERKFWANLCRALDCGQFIDDQFAEGARREQIVQAIAAIFRMRTAAEWFECLRQSDVCVTPVRSLEEVLAECPDRLPAIPKLAGLGEVR
jgi:crotonobetainyl-CoA:carnitine CoA-transferase CaiB-like acyl-CoA transferase